MTKLEELIKELCPNGVEFVKLGELLNYEQPQKYIVKDTKYDNSFKTPVLTAGQTFILGYTNESEGIYQASSKNPVIIFDDFTTSFHWVDFDFKVKSSAMKMLRVKDMQRCLFKYVFYAMQTLKYVPYGHTRQWIENYSRLQIPLPPLAVQREIVQILDKFTLLSAELTAELTARSKQYEFYRDKLLSFNRDINWFELNDVIISLNTGLNPRQFFVLNTDDAKNYYVTIRELQNNRVFFSDKTDRINDEALKLCNNRSNLEVGDVLFSGTGTIGETALIEAEPANWNIKEGVYSIKPNKQKLNSKFLMYVLKSSSIREMYLKKAAGGTVKSVPMSEMRKLKIPVPSLDIQERIVNVLDNFDAICSDLGIGLPAEIEKRQQQYEYYRDKLLTF